MHIVPFASLNDWQVVEVARLHRAVISSLLAELGEAFLERYYRIVRAAEETLGFCALNEAQQPLGWVCGSPAPARLMARLREPPAWFVLHLARAVIPRPALIFQLWVSARLVSLEVPPGCIELTYLGVAPSARRQGVGSALLQEFLRTSAPRYRCVMLSVETENAAAIALYTRAGFRAVETFREGRYSRQRMELELV